MRFAPLFSGSSGNSAYAGNSEEGILIDAGTNCKQLSAALEFIGVRPQEIKHIFVTHEHSDHVSALRVFAKKYGCTVHASEGTLNALLRNGDLDGVKYSLAVSGVQLATMTVRPFRTSHDSRESLGFTVSDGDSKLAVISDTGYITNEIMNAALGSDLVMIESNHDVNMLRTGPYPYVLKQRILSPLGHLSNDACAETVAELYRNGTTRFVLSHLSRENNDPAVAYAAALSALSALGAEEGVSFTLDVAEPRSTSPFYLSF